MNRILTFLKNWALPLGMFAGGAVYLLFHYLPVLGPLKPLAENANTHILPAMVFVMLFTTFCKVDPAEMRPCRWHLVMLALQAVVCLTIALPLHLFPHAGSGIIAQGALVCLIAPTGTAAAVIAGRLGGNETTLTTYTIISNLAAAVMIPVIFPLVAFHSAGSFSEQFFLILRHVFPLLLCPFFAAWGLRAFFPKAHARVTRLCGNLAFYLWAISLVIAIGLTLRSVVNSRFDAHVLWILAGAGLAACIWQFGTGKLVGRHYRDYIACGQGSGQKNTIFAIWVAYTYLSSVVSIAPSSYILWQNCVNSWQLWKKQRQEKREEQK